MALETELATFRRELPKLLADPATRGAFALVCGDAVADCFPTFDAALAAGYDRFGLASFLVKQVVEREAPAYFPRNL